MTIATFGRLGLLPEVNDTQARLDTLRSDADRLNEAWDLEAKTNVTPEFQAAQTAWLADYENLKTFAAGSAGFTWSSDIDTWQQKLVNWQGVLQNQFKGKMVGPDVTPKTPPSLPTLPWYLDPKVIVPVGVGAAAIYVFAPVLKELAVGWAAKRKKASAT